MIVSNNIPDNVVISNPSKMKIWKGLLKDYNSIDPKDDNTLYVITDADSKEPVDNETLYYDVNDKLSVKNIPISLVTDLSDTLNNKIDSPLVNGVSGQVLSLDSQLNEIWTSLPEIPKFKDWVLSDTFNQHVNNNDNDKLHVTQLEKTDWSSKFSLPSNGVDNDVLVKTGNGAKWNKINSIINGIEILSSEQNFTEADLGKIFLWNGAISSKYIPGELYKVERINESNNLKFYVPLNKNHIKIEKDESENKAFPWEILLQSVYKLKSDNTYKSLSGRFNNYYAKSNEILFNEIDGYYLKFIYGKREEGPFEEYIFKPSNKIMTRSKDFIDKLNAGNPYKCISKNNNEYNNLKYKLKFSHPYIDPHWRSIDGVRMNNGVPVGTIVSYYSNDIFSVPDGYLPCNGSKYSIDTYVNLYAIIQDTFGGEDEMFYVPDLNERFLQGTSFSSDVGSMIAAGIPNVKGEPGIGKPSNEHYNPTLSFYYDQTKERILAFRDSGKRQSLTFDASKGQTDINGKYIPENDPRIVYGKSNTVQPPAMKIMFCIKY